MCDGLLFPDRTPSPGLVEYKKVIEPVLVEGDGTVGTVRVTNRHDFADLATLAFTWSYEVDGVPVESGPLAVPTLAPGESADVKLPAPPDAARGAETQWTVRAALADDTAWADRGHVVAWGQLPASGRQSVVPASGASPVREAEVITLGPAVFDARTGELRSVGQVPVTGVRLDVWRAPTDNDNGADWQADRRFGLLWRTAGLHRMRHRLDQVLLESGALTVRTRVAPAAEQFALGTEYRWTADDAGRLSLTVSVTPEGDWTVPLPAWASVSVCRRPPRTRAGSAAVPARPTRTRVPRRGSACGRRPSTSSRLRTCARRRTVRARMSAGWRSAACGSPESRSSRSRPAAGRANTSTRPGTARTWWPGTRCG